VGLKSVCDSEEKYASLSRIEEEFLGAAATYVLTPWSRMLLEKLTGSQLVKKFPAFY
jgi:hypothetical protein